MINLLVSSRAQPPRPYLMLNAIALLLTALPEAYCRVLQNEFLAVIDSGVLSGMALPWYDFLVSLWYLFYYLSEMTFEEIVFDEFEERQLLQMASRPLIVNVVAQAYWYHSNLVSIIRWKEIFKKSEFWPRFCDWILFRHLYRSWFPRLLEKFAAVRTLRTIYGTL